MEEEIDLRELLGIILKRWWIIVIICIVAVAASYYYTYYFLTPTYEASTKMLVGRIEEGGQDPAAGGGGVELDRELVGTYEQIITSTPVIQEVAAREEHQQYSVSSIQGMVSVSQVGDSGLISVDVTHESPNYAAELSIAVAEIFREHVMEVMNVDNVNIIDPAIVPGSPVSPIPELNMALAGVLGLMLSVFLIFFLEFIDNTIKTADDIEKELGLPVLGSIPHHKIKGKEKARMKEEKSLERKEGVGSEAQKKATKF